MSFVLLVLLLVVEYYSSCSTDMCWGVVHIVLQCTVCTLTLSLL